MPTGHPPPRTVVPVVLAGGIGTRLWPWSRLDCPKQLLRLGGEETLLRQTLQRLDGLADKRPAAGKRTALTVKAATLVCNARHRLLVHEQLAGTPHAGSRIVLEPVGRNTAPALTAAALLVDDPHEDPALLLMPADHVIENVDEFQSAVAAAIGLAGEPVVITFGIVPRYPETGYGYIEQGRALDGASSEPRARVIAAFVEKPDADTAARYVREQRYLWNSGMFLVRASVWLQLVSHYQPRMLSACETAVKRGRAKGPYYWLEPESFAASPSDSIDYAVMEPLTGRGSREPPPGEDAAAPRAIVFPLDAGWSDLGSWSSVLELGPRDAAGNVCHGDVYASGCRDSLLLAQDRFVAGLGLTGTLVVETADAVLIAERDDAQAVKEVVAWLEARGREESRAHRTRSEPWGVTESLHLVPGCSVERVAVHPGSKLASPGAPAGTERLVVVRGTARLSYSGETRTLEPGRSALLDAGTSYAVTNPASSTLELIRIRLDPA